MQQDKEKTAGEDRRQQETGSPVWLDVVMFSVGLVAAAAIAVSRRWKQQEKEQK